MSSLATQLAKNASLNAPILVDRSRRKPTTSYLFTGRDADEHDLEAIHALATNSLLSLSSIEPKLRKFEDDLFSEQAKGTDRTLLSKGASVELDERIEGFLWVLGPHLLEPPTTKILEWLVRKFRIQEFNVPHVLALFLPYHETPHFAKMVTLLHIKPNTLWSFLLPYKSAAQKLPRISLVTEMLKDSELARFISSLLPTAVKKGLVHRTLIAFNAATLHDFIKRSKSLDEGTIAYLLPDLLEPLQQQPEHVTKDAVLGSYILLSSVSQKCKLSPAALQVVVGALVSACCLVREDQFIQTLVAVCRPQSTLDKFPDSLVKNILKTPNVKETLSSVVSWEGCEKVFLPLVQSLVSKLSKEARQSLLESIIAAPAVPLVVIDSLTSHLLHIAVKPDSEGNTSFVARRLLSLVHQRYPAAFQKAVEHLSEADESLKDALEQLVITLSTVKVSNTSNRIEGMDDLIVSSSSAEERTRTMAVKELIMSVAGGKTEDLEIIRSALIARLQDTNTAVLEVLYQDPSTVTSIFSKDPLSFIGSLSLAFSSQAKPRRNIIRLHLIYLLTHFWLVGEPSIRDEIVHQILFPFLLFTKPRQKSAELVWDVIRDYLSRSDESSALSWLEGCAALVKAELSVATNTDSVELMNQINFSISSKIADNIINSNSFTDHLASIVTKLCDEDSHVRFLAYLIALALLKKSSGQVDIAEKILSAMDVDELSGVDDMSQEHLVLENPVDIEFGKYIITKPNSRTTIRWMQIAIIAAISRIPCPTNVVLNWVTESSKCTTEDQRYVRLMRKIYQLANASTSLPVVSSAILQLLFVSLKDQSLSFLAGVWTGSIEEFKDSKAVSLLHAAAFLEAHILEDDGLDFQTILPSLLVALYDSDSQVCKAALECISRIWILVDRALRSVYQFDTIYGQSDNMLQYLDQADLKRYLTSLVEHRDHLSNDPSYLGIFHQQHLGKVQGDKKKDADYKHRVICFLLSHANAFPSESGQTALMRSIATLSSKEKVQILLPSIQAFVDKAASMSPAEVFSSMSEELTIRLLASYDVVVARYFNANPPAWNVLLKAVHTYLRAGTPLSVQRTVVRSLTGGLFAALTRRRQVALCSVLLEVGSNDSSAQSLARTLMSDILSDVPLITKLLDALAPADPANNPRAAKRAKTSASSEDPLLRLALFAEILGTKSLPGSLDLIIRLLDTLSKVVQILPASQADVIYIQQLLMSAIESTSSKIKEIPNISPSVIRVDILVELIRVSGNPQIFHQALLLIVSLARLSPDSVLFNVMPVFTFMGSNVFHRDDAYSFKVVQETIDGIVPVMASSLRQAHSQPLDLYLAAKEFLRVFTDAAAHIPRHRRNSFFSHLVGVLGSQEFLPPVCMLLLERSSNRVVRQSPDDLQNTLSLPISLYQQTDHNVQIHTAMELLCETQRLIVRLDDSQSIQPTFMEGTVDGDHSVSTSTILKRRAQALIIFVGFALKPRKASSPAEDTNTISAVIAQLISLAAVPQLDDIAEAARSSLNRLLSSMSVIDFVVSMQNILASGDVKVQAGALDVLATRLPDVSVQMRPLITDNIKKILSSIKDFLHIHKAGDGVDYAFHSLKSIAETLCSGEEGSLADVVPYIISALSDRESASSSLSALPSISVKIGPRIIPFFRQIISQCTSILRGVDQSLFANAISTLHGLLKTIPAFWGSGELSQIILLYMDQISYTPNTAVSSGVLTLTKSVAKKLPAKILLPALLEMWNPLQDTKNPLRISAYFDVLGRALQHADRPTVLDHLRELFKIFLEALDIVKARDEAESRVISAFREMVVKLNEAAFKPLFRRLHDWAYIGEIDNERKIAFNHLYIDLLDFFKGLMVPYVSFLIQPLCDILNSFETLNIEDSVLWSSIIGVLSRALSYDDNGFWRDDKHRQILDGLASQVEVCMKLNLAEGKKQLQDCLVALLESITDDTLIKTINLNILMHTRSENPRTRSFALSCSEVLWRTHGGKLLGFVTETAAFIAECGEDENDLVVDGAFKLKEAVESIAGKIDGL